MYVTFSFARANLQEITPVHAFFCLFVRPMFNDPPGVRDVIVFLRSQKEYSSQRIWKWCGMEDGTHKVCSGIGQPRETFAIL